jgi:A/G-specific adenine glycosylase
VQGVAVRLERRGRVLAVKRAAGGLLGGLWELPGGDLAPRENPLDGARRLLDEGLGLSASNIRTVGRVKHAFTHRDLTLHVLEAEASPGRLRRRGFAEHRWLAAEAFHDLPAATVTRKALAVFDR